MAASFLCLARQAESLNRGDRALTNAAVADPPAEATGATSSDEATAKGTAEDSVTVQAENNGADTQATSETDSSAAPADGEETVDELKYSEASLTAERESAHVTGATEARKADAAARKERSAKVIASVKASGNDDPAVIRDIAAAFFEMTVNDDNGNPHTFKSLGLDPEAIIQRVKTATGSTLAASADIAAESLAAGIDGALKRLGLKPEADFWPEAEGLDPDLHASVVLDLLVEKAALSAKAVSAADPEALIKANPKLKAFVAKQRDDGYSAGRTQGRKDPIGARGDGSGSAGAGANSYSTKEQARALHVQGKISHEEMRRVRDDASIPER